MKKIIVCFFLAALFVSCSNQKQNTADYSNGNFISRWNWNLTETIVQDLFTPPVASRIYSYPNLAAYEVLKFSAPDNQSITSKLREFEAVPSPPSEDINLTVAALNAYTLVALKMVYTESVLKDYYKTTIDSLAKTGISKEQIEKAESYGKTVADVILKRAGKDMFKQTRGMTRYMLKETPGSWVPTPPDYMQGVEPNFRLIHPFTLDSCSSFRETPPQAFSEENNSDFYKSALEVVNTFKSLDSEKIEITKYWDDNPNVSTHLGHLTIFDQKMTPGGHWMAIVSNVVKNKNLTQPDAAHAFAMVAVSLFDAFIACWDSKYNYSTIRPVTYINKNIDNDWRPFLQTPPFPEYPSGHSTISASAATILTEYFGADYAFTDSSEVPFHMPVRSFHSFFEAADEAAMSRLFGGIHFRSGNEAGKILGKKVGRKVLETIQATTQKP